MGKYEYDKVKHMFSLETDYPNIGHKQIPINKTTSRILKEARAAAKGSTCYLCGKKCESFCNSHSIPQFTLESIAENGKLVETLQGELPLIKNTIGLNKTGTFNLICDDCDNTAFQDYENPYAYSTRPNDIMLAQISLKNCLQMISKRKIEIEFFRIMEERFDNFSNFPSEGTSIEERDLQEYIAKLQYAKKTISKGLSNRYHICFFKVLDYVVPYATQTMICPIVDLEDNLVNNTFNLSDKYRLEHLQVAVFPLENTSVILLFVEDGVKRYRKFIKQLNKLDEEDQLATINYMIFSYTENVFLNANTHKVAKENPAFMEACRKNPVAECPDLSFDPLPAAMQVFSFSHRKTMPNLLSRDYALR